MLTVGSGGETETAAETETETETERGICIYCIAGGVSASTLTFWYRPLRPSVYLQYLTTHSSAREPVSRRAAGCTFSRRDGDVKRNETKRNEMKKGVHPEHGGGARGGSRDNAWML